MNLRLLIAALVAAASFAFTLIATPVVRATDSPASSVSAARSRADAIDYAYAHRLRHQQVEGYGTVVKLLADDLNGSRHQRFIVRLDSGRTVLLSHNIDLAARIDALRKGDAVHFYGEYEWNPRGGLVHWTHRDPQRRHTPGWIRHDGKIYQ